jgi:integrase
MAGTAVPRYHSSIAERRLRDGTSVFDVRYRRLDRSSTSRSFDTREGAERWRAMLAHLGPVEATKLADGEGDNSVLIGGQRSEAASATIAAYAEHHFEVQTEANDNTVEGYRRFLRNGLAPLADIPIGSLTKAQVVIWVKDRVQQVSSKTVKNEHAFLSRVLRRAVDEGVIATNPARGVAIPKGLRQEMTFLTPAEFKQLLSVVPDRWKHVPLLLAGTGLRWAELTALSVSDVDLNRKQIRVTRAWKRTKPTDGKKGHWFIGPPKSPKARREIALTDQLVDVLRPLVKGKLPSDLVITAIGGGPLRQQKFYETIWAPVRNVVNGIDAYPVVEKGVNVKYRRDRDLYYTRPLDPPIGKAPRVHDLRHSHASWLLEQGISLHVLQYRLGHASITTTVDRYGHLSPSSQAEARDATQRAMADPF